MKPCKGCRTVKQCIQKGRCLGNNKKKPTDKREVAKTAPGQGY